MFARLRAALDVPWARVRRAAAAAARGGPRVAMTRVVPTDVGARWRLGAFVVLSVALVAAASYWIWFWTGWGFDSARAPTTEEGWRAVYAWDRRRSYARALHVGGALCVAGWWSLRRARGLTAGARAACVLTVAAAAAGVVLWAGLWCAAWTFRVRPVL